MTPTTVPLLFNLLSDASLTIRLATCGALSRIVAKGLKEPSDKLQLIKVLSLGQVLDALETKTRAEQASRGSDIDEGEESYREALGRLLNVLGLELSKVIEVCAGLDLTGTGIELDDRKPRTKRSELKLTSCLTKLFRSCFDSWRTNTTILARQYSLSCRRSLVA